VEIQDRDGMGRSELQTRYGCQSRIHGIAAERG
jgi:hypothetical protein